MRHSANGVQGCSSFRLVGAARRPGSRRG